MDERVHPHRTLENLGGLPRIHRVKADGFVGSMDWGISGIPGLVNIQKAIENCPVEIVDLSIKNGGSFQFVL